MGSHENKIDHVTINNTWRSSLQDSRVNFCADVRSDHHLAEAEIKMKLYVGPEEAKVNKKQVLHLQV